MKQFIAIVLLALMLSSVQAAVVSNVISQGVGTPPEGAAGSGNIAIAPTPAPSGGTGGGGGAGAGVPTKNVACNRHVQPYSGFLCDSETEMCEGIQFEPTRDIGGFCCSIGCIKKVAEAAPEALPAVEEHAEVSAFCTCQDMNPCTSDSCAEEGCVYATSADGAACYFGGIKGACSAGNCAIAERPAATTAAVGTPTGLLVFGGQDYAASAIIIGFAALAALGIVIGRKRL